MPKTGWLLIDGYNLLHASGVFGNTGRTSLESSREALLDWLGEVLSDGQRQRTTIVFDAREAPPGLPRFSQRHSIQIQFAPRGTEADDLLEELIQVHTSPKKLTVVSSDHRIHRAARRRKAQPVDSEVWVTRITSSAREEQQDTERYEELDPDEVRDMLEGLDETGC